jgi:hypothetical protein
LKYFFYIIVCFKKKKNMINSGCEEQTIENQ